jgi:hypothetical protein
MELWPWGLEGAGTDAREFENAYRSLGMHAYQLQLRDRSFLLSPVENLAEVAAKVPTDWGAHFEILVTNQALTTLGLASYLVWNVSSSLDNSP